MKIHRIALSYLGLAHIIIGGCLTLMWAIDVTAFITAGLVLTGLAVAIRD